MPKVKNVIDTMANTSSLLASPAINIADAFEGVANCVNFLANPFDTYDNEVNHRPAVQKWTVRTP